MQTPIRRPISRATSLMNPEDGDSPLQLGAIGSRCCGAMPGAKAAPQRGPASNQPEAVEAGVTLAIDDDMVVQRHAYGLQRPH